MNIHRVFGILAACALAITAPSAFALSTWNFGTSGGCTQGATNNGTYGNSWSCTGSNPAGPTVTATAWSTTGNSGASFAAANAAQYGTSGFGVRNTTETLGVAAPDHSMDNNGQTDLLSLNFASVVKLDSLSLGWYQNDSDVSVLAYTGASPPPASITGKTVANLVASGWTLVANLSNVGSSTPTFNAGGTGSSWWLISAYNGGYNGSTALDGNADYVKLLSVSNSTPGKVPEPGSLALIGLAASAAVGLRRRKTQNA